jgi:hypothetical protein
MFRLRRESENQQGDIPNESPAVIAPLAITAPVREAPYASQKSSHYSPKVLPKKL